ncbi:MAG: HAD family phosphatase [Steroidobacteraceae bacterium]|nr:HAD family phosphatase [Steroidobacteraceae bacterium]MBP7013750.1 HAD family phosphatase [Steroidobacteraceae bacterium]
MIRNVVFDVGNVLVKLHYQPFVAYLVESGVDLSDLPGWLKSVDLEGHERGEVPGHILLERIAGAAARPLDLAELHAQWISMFEPWDEMFALASGLKADYRVYLLSNIGDMHWAHLDTLYGLDTLVHGACASFRVGAIKPHADIYRKAESMFDLDPAATVFLDDLLSNVAGARDCGWHAIHHTDAGLTRSQLRALGVRLPAPFT